MNSITACVIASSIFWAPALLCVLLLFLDTPLGQSLLAWATVIAIIVGIATVCVALAYNIPLGAAFDVVVTFKGLM